MIVEIDKGDLENWQDYLAVDEDGTVNLFHKVPENISGKFVPSEFRKQNYKSCVGVNEKLSDHSGKVFEFYKAVNDKSYWKELDNE